MPSSSNVANGHYRIRQAGAKSQVAIEISNGKKCHYVQIGTEKTPFGSMDEALEFVEGKGLEADSLSLDYGKKKAQPVEASEPVEDASEPVEEVAEE